MTNLASDRLVIRTTKKQAFECPLCFEVRIQVELDGHPLVWTMAVLPGCGFRFTSIYTSSLSSSLTVRNFWLAVVGWTEHFLSRYRKKR